MAVLGDIKAISLSLLNGVIGNLVPITNGDYSLGTSDKKWSNIWASYINGIAIPASPKFTDTVTTITTTAGVHSTISNKSGTVSFNVPTKTSHLTNDSGFITASHTSTYSLPLAASGTRGGVQIGYTESGKNYAVKLSSEKMYVSVPWTDTDEKLKLAEVTSGTIYYPIVGTNSTTAATRQHDTNGFEYYVSNGTTSVNGMALLTLGNAISEGTANNKQGIIRLHGIKTNSVDIVGPGGADNAIHSIAFPAKTGTVALTSDIPNVSGKIDTAGTGLSKSGTTLNHSNSVTAGTAGTSSATSGSTLAVPYVTYDAQGHITATGTHTHTISGFASSSHDHSQIITVGDKRSEATTPNSYANKIIFQGLKNKATIGSPSTDTYSYLVGLRGWSDSSGGNSHEFAFNDSGINWRTGATTAWNAWYKLLSTKDFNSTTSVGTIGSNKVYAVGIDANGKLAVNVPWENSTYSLSGLGGVGTVSASGTAPLTLNASKSGTTVSITGSVDLSWSNISSKPINFITNTSALNSSGWKTLGGRTSQKSIAISYASSSPATWNSESYSSSIVFGCNDTKGMIDIGYNSSIVTFGGGSTSGSTDDAPHWYFKLSGTSGKTYTFPNDSKTLAATDGTGASGTWGISITGSAGSVAWDNVTGKPTIPTVPSNIVNTITTTAGTHSAISSKSGAVSFNVPTKTSHLTNDSGFITSSHTSTYSLPLAASGTRGGVQIGYTQSGKNYPVQLSNEKMYVNVPWTDTNTEVSTLTLASGSTAGTSLAYGGKYTLTAGSKTVSFTMPASDNTNTTYALSGALSSHKFTSTLTAGGSGSGTSTSDFTLAAGTGISITDTTSSRTMTIACTISNTDTKVKLTSNTGSTAVPLVLGPTSISSGSAYECLYNTNLNYVPSTGTLTTTKLTVSTIDHTITQTQYDNMITMLGEIV